MEVSNTVPASLPPMAEAAELLMGIHMVAGHDERGYTLLTVTAPYACNLPQEFVNACHQWAGENDYGIKFVDAATGKRVILRAR
jgi:hypothetical protein